MKTDSNSVGGDVRTEGIVMANPVGGPLLSVGQPPNVAGSPAEPGAASGPPRPPRPSRPPVPRSRLSAWSNGVVLAWLALAGAAVLAHSALPVPTWLAVHLLVLGAASNAIVIWSENFVVALCRTPARPTRQVALTLGVLNLAVLAVLIGVTAALTWLAILGAAGIVLSAVAHGTGLSRRGRRTLSNRFIHVRRFYAAAAAALVCTAILGAVLLTGLGGPPWHQRLWATHVHVAVLGWIGLAVLGTLITLWPTVLSTRITGGAELLARRALWPLVIGLTVLVGGLLVGSTAVAVAGLAGYATGAGVSLVPFVRTLRVRTPRTPSAWMLALGTGWLLVAICSDAVLLVRAGSVDRLPAHWDWLVPVLLAGFVVQVLVGALTYLLASHLAVGPEGRRAVSATLERAWIPRVLLANLAVLMVVAPVGTGPRAVGWTLLAACYGGFAVLALRTVVMALRPVAGRRRPTGPTDADSAGPAESAGTADSAGPAETAETAETEAVEPVDPAAPSGGPPPNDPPPTDPPPHTPPPGEPPPGGRRSGGKPPYGRRGAVGGVVVGLAATLVAVLVATTGNGPNVGAGHQHAGGPADGTSRTGGTRTVDITIAQMRYHPGQITVVPGTHLVLRVTNHDVMAHDLRLETGQQTPMLAPHSSATLDAGVVTGQVEGWCTVPGHRAAGMTLDIRTGGAAADETTSSQPTTGPLDLARAPTPGWTPRDAVLPPAPTARVHRIELHATEHRQQVAPGVFQTMWTFGGTAPGPTLRGNVGDVFEITLVNDASMGHGIDFHASTLAPDQAMRTIAPGERLVYTFTARHAGIWLYHCSTEPMLEHIANGMYGAVIIDPPGLRPVDREFILVDSELYLGVPGSSAQVAKMNEDRPDAWMFNGMAAQYHHAPLKAKAGERVRFWVLNAGPEDSLAFHIVGTQFDTVYKEGAYLLGPSAQAGGAQVLDLAPAQGGFVETVLPAPGHYSFMDHNMRHAQDGAHGILDVGK